MTYYKIQKYLIEHGLSVGRADYVRNMILGKLRDDKTLLLSFVDYLKRFDVPSGTVAQDYRDVESCGAGFEPTMA